MSIYKLETEFDFPFSDATESYGSAARTRETSFTRNTLRSQASQQIPNFLFLLFDILSNISYTIRA
jgi:hypothetical protein